MGYCHPLVPKAHESREWQKSHGLGQNWDLQVWSRRTLGSAVCWYCCCISVFVSSVSDILLAGTWCGIASWSTCGGLKALTILLVQSQTDFLLDHRPYFKHSKALHEVKIIQHWALGKGLDEPGCQPLSFVAGRNWNDETETTYLPSCWPRGKNGKPAWDNKGQRVIFWLKQKPAQSFAYSTKFCLPLMLDIQIRLSPPAPFLHFGANGPRFLELFEKGNKMSTTHGRGLAFPSIQPKLLGWSDLGQTWPEWVVSLLMRWWHTGYLSNFSELLTEATLQLAAKAGGWEVPGRGRVDVGRCSVAQDLTPGAPSGTWTPELEGC